MKIIGSELANPATSIKKGRLIREPVLYSDPPFLDSGSGRQKAPEPDLPPPYSRSAFAPISAAEGVTFPVA